MHFNTGPQDGLLQDVLRSYFKNIGYTRTAPFSYELRDVDPVVGANLGQNVTFNIPKAADLLGNVDLMIDLKQADTSGITVGSSSGQMPAADAAFWGWVDHLGYAMIEKMTLQIGTHDIETITGEEMNIQNELMKSDLNTHGYNQILKTGRPLVRGHIQATNSTSAPTGVLPYIIDERSDAKDRIIAHKAKGATSITTKPGKKLCIPLQFFFTKHPSQFFPLAAIAGVNDVRINIKFRPLSELLMCHGGYTVGAQSGTSDAYPIDATVAAKDCQLSKIKFDGSAFERCQLRCAYVHVTGPEATSLMNSEHVRLMKMWSGNHISKQFIVTCNAAGSAQTLDLDLSFLHPVTELIITIRKVSDMGGDTTNTHAIGQVGTATKAAANTAQTKNYFAYHGNGKDPNPESVDECIDMATAADTDLDHAKPTTIKVKNFVLKLNGQTKHLDGQGVDREYLMDRWMPQLHSNTSEKWTDLMETIIESNPKGVNSAGDWHDNNHELVMALKTLGRQYDRKEIYSYPFSLAPEGQNPAGHLNFSKVSHAKLSIAIDGIAPSAGTTTATDEYQVDVHGIYYNWLTIKDGRGMLSFA